MRQLMPVKAGLSTGADDHGGHQGSRGRRVISQDIVAGGIEAELREEGRAHGASFARTRALQAARFGVRAKHVHEEAELVVDVESWVDRFAEAHFMAFANLVVFAEDGAEGRASVELGQAFVEVPVLGVIAGLSKCALDRGHDTHGHCNAGELVAPREKRRRP